MYPASPREANPARIECRHRFDAGPRPSGGLERIIKGEPAEEDQAYLGFVHHPQLGKLAWMIFLLPGRGAWREGLAMSVRLVEEYWWPEILDAPSVSAINDN